MKSKNPDTENPTAARLVEMAKERHKEVEQKASKAEAENQERIAELTAKEKELKDEIAIGEKTLGEMITGFEQLEKEVREANLAELKADALTVEDVKAGKITIAQFQAQGMREDDIEKEATLKTKEGLEKSSDAIREKATEIAHAELALCEAQNSIHNLMLMPVRSLLTSYVQLQDMLNYQLAPLSAESHAAQSDRIQIEHRMQLIEHGVSASGGFVWSNLSLEDAHRVQHDPVLPKEQIIPLLEKLNDIEVTEKTRVSITFYPKGSAYPGDPIEVREEL